MSNLARLLWSVPAGDVAPTTVNFTAAEFAPGFAGPTSTTKTAGRIYFRVQLTVWSGWITGSEAKWTMTSNYGDYDGAVQVAVDGGAFSNAPRAGQIFTLFTGLPSVAHYVEIRITDGLGDEAYMLATGNVLTVTGAPPALQVLPNIVTVGSDSANGIYSGSMIATTATFAPPTQAPSGQVYGSNVGSVKIKGAFTKLIVSLNGARKVGVSKNGGVPSFYSIADESGGPSRSLVIPCDGSTSVYNVWDSGNGRAAGGIFAVAGDATFLDIGTRRRLDQYGDSITYGSGPNATSCDTETMHVAAKLGFVGSTTGVSGQTISIDGKNMIDASLAGRNVSSGDIAILALGGNSAADGISSTEQADYNIMIDKLLTKGYGKVFCRGILPVANTDANNIVITANAVLKSLVDARANPNVIWIDPVTWTGVSSLDGVHPDAAGYLTLANYAYPAYLPHI
jgi:lysophospholipase L1-like esterase